MEQSVTPFIDKLNSKGSNIINISRGPQFGSKGGYLIAFLFIMMVILSLVSLVNAEFIIFLFLAVISILLFYVVVDIHGIEVDPRLHMIREYKAILWFKFGEWMNISDFKSIYLMQKNVVTTSYYSRTSSETYHYYHIKLVDELHKKEIILAEFKNYYKARHISQGIAETTGLAFKDFLKGGKR
jgi:hypothetical protein